MRALLLDGDWTLCGAPEPQLPKTPDALAKSTLPRMTAKVPGNVELDLFRAGISPDPYFGENLYAFRPYEFYGWWLERTFTLPEEWAAGGVDLFVNGADTFATVYLNGQELLRTDDMMMEYAADATALLLAGENRISVRIDSAINRARMLEYPIGVRGPGNEHTDEMIRVRKPGHCFGWDIAPRFVSAGLWRSVGLRARETTRILETYWATLTANDREAMLLCKCRFETQDETLDGFAFQVEGVCEDSRFQAYLPVKFVSDEMTIRICAPKLWWPCGYGESNLYTVTLTLLHHGQPEAVKTERIGIRTAMVEARFVTGEESAFQIRVNDVPILAKGSNWVPLDALHSRDVLRLDAAVRLFQECGCNLVRCWGGNVYEDTRFFDLCDEYGLLVWQDFSLACALYPQDDNFAGALEKETAQVVRKLRNHASLLLWSGDNEVDAMYYAFGYRLPHVRENRLSRETLPRIVASHDPMRYYLPSSPYLPPTIPNDLAGPEQHLWGPRAYFKGDFYRQTKARFISEIGYHGCPAISSLRRFIDREHLWPMQNGQWDAHNTEYARGVRDRGYDRNQLMANQVRELFGETPVTLERFAMLSQCTQAEALKFFVEMVRLGKWEKTGILWWNMLDCWPQISDAVVDYYFQKKLAFFYLTRVQKPICLICDEPSAWRVRVWLCNDSREGGTVAYRVADGETGEVLLEGEAVTLANENVLLGEWKAFSGEHRLILMRWSYNGREYGNHAVLGYPAWDGDRYRKWISAIEALPSPFSAEGCWQGRQPADKEAGDILTALGDFS